MVVTRGTILKKYLAECIKLFVKHRIKISLFVTFVLTLASMIYMFGEFCFVEYFLIVPTGFSKQFVKTNSPQRGGLTDLTNFQKIRLKTDIQTRALQRRVKELTVRSEFGGQYLTRRQAQDLIAEALRIYNSDKLGIRDYALESIGASIISVPSTKPAKLSKEYVLFSFIAVPVYSNPREIIQADVIPGKCFTFEGSEGKIRIKLANVIYITSVTLESCPINLLTNDEVLQTPKNFQVNGLNAPDSSDGILLGHFIYNIEGSSAQNFAIKDYKNYPPFEFVELFIIDNYGHFKYTSIYRFRVHGETL